MSKQQNDIDIDLRKESLKLADDLVILVSGIATIPNKDYELLRTTLNNIFKKEV
jgi:hypothetical protein